MSTTTVGGLPISADIREVAGIGKTTPAANVTLAAGEQLVVYGAYTVAAGVAITLQGDSVLRIL